MLRQIQAASFSAEQVMDILQAGTTFGNGAILIDEYDNLIFDDILRRYPAWQRIDKRLAPGETTGGFEQSGIATARSAPVRNLGFTATGPTRAARTRRDIKALVANTSFGIFDRSVYQQQGRRFGNLEAKDVADLMTACMRRWSRLFYAGSVSSDALEFDGILTILTPGSTVAADESIYNAINSAIVDMMNTDEIDVMPTAILTNARVVFMLEQELLKMGNKLLYGPVYVGPSVMQLAQLYTPAGLLPLFVDPFNRAVAGTPVTYPTVIASEDKISWQYVEPLGMPGAEPKTFEIAMTNPLDLQYTTVQFGAIELLGGTDHHKRLNIENRTTVVDPTAE
jgi:hypothetical protein